MLGTATSTGRIINARNQKAIVAIADQGEEHDVSTIHTVLPQVAEEYAFLRNPDESGRGTQLDMDAQPTAVHIIRACRKDCAESTG